MRVEHRQSFQLRDGRHRLTYVPGQTDVLIIAFAGFGRRGGIMPEDEFVEPVRAQGDHHALFVSDRRRSWLNAPELVDDLSRTVASLRAVDGIKRVVTLGQTIGAYSALAAAHHFQVDAALALGPQESMHPDFTIEPERWAFWRRKLKSHLLKRLSPLPDHGAFTIIHGVPDDAAQAEAFARQGNLDHFLLEGVGHGRIVQHLTIEGLLDDLLGAVIAGDRAAIAKLAARAGATPR